MKKALQPQGMENIRKNTIILQGRRTESSNNQKQRHEYGTVHQRQIYHFRLHLRSHLYDFFFITIIIAASFNQDNFVRLIVFVCSNLLGWLLYLSFQTVIFDTYEIYRIKFGKRR